MLLDAFCLFITWQDYSKSQLLVTLNSSLANQMAAEDQAPQFTQAHQNWTAEDGKCCLV